MKSGYIMFALVGLLYTFLFFTQEAKTIEALYASLGVLKMIIPIMMVVFFIMALINAYIDEKSIVKHMGDESGLKGWSIALIAGILSHGPSYIWYPMIQSLREKGVNDGLVITFLYARSIKLPWLPIMISYFGLTFTAVLTIYVIIASLFQGAIVKTFFKLKND